jgi:hypothetical protein
MERWCWALEQCPATHSEHVVLGTAGKDDTTGDQAARRKLAN